jgi:hypothetical protein
MVQTGAVIGVADIHARPLAHGVEPFENLDRFRAVIGVVGADIAGRFSHGRHLQGDQKIESELSFCVTRKTGLVQGNLVAVNMLIRQRFLKARRDKNRRIFGAVFGAESVAQNGAAEEVSMDRNAAAESVLATGIPLQVGQAAA